MKDLTFIYKTKEGETDFRAYTLITDFTSFVEANPNSKFLEGTHVKAEFFENPKRRKEFATILELYNFCREIMS